LLTLCPLAVLLLLLFGSVAAVLWVVESIIGR
jgi:hypothetical protein